MPARMVDKRIRTLIFHPALSPYRVDLFNHLAREVDLRLVLLSRAPRYSSAHNQTALENSLQCDYEFLPDSLRIPGSEIRLGLAAATRRFHPHVVCTSEFADVTLRMILRRRWRAREDFGHVLWTDESPVMQESRGLTRRWLRRMRCHRVDSMVVCSPAVKEAFVRGGWIGDEQSFVCGVHQSPTTVRAKLEAGRVLAARIIGEHSLQRRKVVLFVGRLVENKDPMSLLEAFARARAAQPECTLVYVGSGSLDAPLRARAAALGLASRDVIFAGHREGADLYVWYAIAAILVRPSVFEPYGAVINEALLCGVPTICSSAAGAAWLVKTGSTGRIFNPRDTGRLATLLADTLRCAPEAPALAGRQRDNLMPVSFDADVGGFVKAIEYAGSCRERRAAGQADGRRARSAGGRPTIDSAKS
jgi:glycosyltransferase involved in cell wall biosynthesis